MNASASTEKKDDALPGASSSSSQVVRGEDNMIGYLKESSLSFLTAVELQVFKTFVKNFLVNRKLSREDATALTNAFGPIIQQVFDLKRDVGIYESPLLKLVFVRVFEASTSTVPKSYWFTPGHSMCLCTSFTNGNKPYCKHILAAHLLLALTPKEKYKTISGGELQSVMKNLIEP